MSITYTSRIGRKPVVFPAGVDVKIHDYQLLVKGPKGQLTLKLHPFVNVSIENNEIMVTANQNKSESITGASAKLYRSIVGTVRANINNVIQGITNGFEKKLILVGVGYRAQSQGKMLSLSLGYSHATDFNVPEGIVIETPTQTEILIKGIDKTLVGEVAAKIRKIRAPELYKGKGVRYANEIIELKETKKK